MGDARWESGTGRLEIGVGRSGLPKIIRPPPGSAGGVLNPMAQPIAFGALMADDVALGEVLNGDDGGTHSKIEKTESRKQKWISGFAFRAVRHRREDGAKFHGQSSPIHLCFRNFHFLLSAFLSAIVPDTFLLSQF